MVWRLYTGGGGERFKTFIQLADVQIGILHEQSKRIFDRWPVLLTVAELLVDRIVEILRRVRIRTRAAAHEHASSCVFHVQHLCVTVKN